MFLQSITIIGVLFGCLEAKPVIYRNVSDCSITVDEILHYQGKHSFSKFEHECLAWTDLQTIYPDVINEPNFFNDASVKAAKNYCRNPNMNVNGPWCYIQDGDEIIAEECAVCQSLASRPTFPTNVEISDDMFDMPVRTNFFQHVRDELQRYGIFVRDKVLEIINRMHEKMRNFRARVSDHFNY
ncbi:unnamed protein product [Adineta ricciae]|uniref:Kringle domain-containing protein n=1 Tax=Adineta ricciae TaxID=249248 RepID=A0A813Q9V2_ADIRI|nr:unnamed protein product [Adineta ricciae]CAF1044374.1 unnamed protein product [Adineta ricciae]